MLLLKLYQRKRLPKGFLGVVWNQGGAVDFGTDDTKI